MPPPSSAPPKSYMDAVSAISTPSSSSPLWPELPTSFSQRLPLQAVQTEPEPLPSLPASAIATSILQPSFSNKIASPSYRQLSEPSSTLWTIFFAALQLSANSLRAPQTLSSPLENVSPLASLPRRLPSAASTAFTSMHVRSSSRIHSTARPSHRKSSSKLASSSMYFRSSNCGRLP